ncbi:aminotransferase class V-fold PLP-dependent enzyme [Yimella sp. cx-51]|uniref:pyridoxal phosphate-dependent decarboxylase family protein n=1 Tax=Yimella sp. cx-51 TaxID=2770551 RepID=UPI00165E01D2|nr:aminotransferase class V-fold PLP-dependent enzyme [Yimella sp. cx-51]MBC9957911.1 aspartate aminotransferase family protein [Yimella sp. cx-51]QTH38046.1 aspartate aminotransferase family protein [Yimella sp. cx-51]
MNRDQIRARLRELQAMDVPRHGGSTFAYVYDSGRPDIDALGLEALAMFGESNGLDPTAFPSLLAMERDLVAMAASFTQAPDGRAGTVTSGGTESILLAVQTARDAHPEIERPTMVLPATAHAAFHKAAHYFGVRPVVVPVRADFRADPEAMAAAIDESTVLVVGSAPSYAHGVVDPIDELASAAMHKDVRMHVDACIGGWVLPFLDDAPAWDFSVPGVTSISVDLHKYAYTPKGVSVLLHRDRELRRPQFFACADWPGYTMLNSTTQSTRSGGPTAAAWAVTRAYGRDGYADLARSAREAARRFITGLPAPLEVLGGPDSTLVAVHSNDPEVDMLVVADQMQQRGQYVQVQLPYAGGPANMHLSMSAASLAIIDDVVAALVESVDAARESGPATVAPELAEAARALDPATLTDADFDGLLQIAGLAGDSGDLALPQQMAPVNALLAVASPALRERLLIAFLDRLS